MKFYKYQGTGNDFIMIDNYHKNNQISIDFVKRICNRKFGVGSDGLISIERDLNSDFYVNYFNSDGSQSFCGNGARCAVQFAKDIGVDFQKKKFKAIDGYHSAILKNNLVYLAMQDVCEIEKINDSTFVLNTGSPHFVKFINEIDSVNILEYGKKIRFSERFYQHGINVNVAQLINNKIHISTYERGVENETFSCGTGAVATVLAYAFKNSVTKKSIALKTKGGNLEVSYKFINGVYKEIYLIGPAKRVFEGIWN